MNAKSSKKRSKTDWNRVRRTKDGQVDLTGFGFTGYPPLGEGVLAEAVLVPVKNKKKKKQITLSLDSDVVAFFLKRGPECQTAINAVLRSYIQSEQVHARKRRPTHAAD